MPEPKIMVIEINPEEIMNTSISKYSDGYNYASVSMKKGKHEFIYISVEWKDNEIPSIVLDLMGFMSTNASTIEEAKITFAKEYEDLAKERASRK